MHNQTQTLTYANVDDHDKSVQWHRRMFECVNSGEIMDDLLLRLLTLSLDGGGVAHNMHILGPLAGDDRR